MNFLQILEAILAIAPQGITLTNDVLALIKEIETLFGTGSVTAANQQSLVKALGAHLGNG